MAYSLIQQYIAKNPRDIKFKQDAQELYFELIADMTQESEKLSNSEYVGQMLEIARKADALYPCSRSREKVDIIEKEYKKLTSTSNINRIKLNNIFLTIPEGIL